LRCNLIGPNKRNKTLKIVDLFEIEGNCWKKI